MHKQAWGRDPGTQAPRGARDRAGEWAQEPDLPIVDGEKSPGWKLSLQSSTCTPRASPLAGEDRQETGVRAPCLGSSLGFFRHFRFQRVNGTK